MLVYSLDIPNDGNFRDGNPVPYSIDNSATAPAFDRIAYYLELDSGSGTSTSVNTVETSRPPTTTEPRPR